MRKTQMVRPAAHGRLKASAIASALAMACFSAHSQESVIISSGSKPMFELDFYNDNVPETDGIAAWSLDDSQKRGIQRGASYLASVLSPGSRNLQAVPLTIMLRTVRDDPDNAEGESGLASPIDTINGTYSRFQKAIIDGVWSQADFSDPSYALKEDGTPADPSHTDAMYYPVGLYVVNQSSSRGAAPYLYPIPTLSSPVEIVSVTVHEMLHAMGIFCGAYVTQIGSSSATVWDYSTFASHLYSYATGENLSSLTGSYRINEGTTGTRLAHGGTVTRASAAYPGSSDFLVGYRSQSGVYFAGDNVDEVLKGAMKGVPVNGYEGSGSSISFDLSHLELAHSMMSHQDWRNHTTLMEAEFAVLQDIGYDIDRRSLYGSSEYRSYQHYTNTSPYFARNDTRDGYLDGVPNLAPLGVGFHVYGSQNKIVQAADLLADGEGGTGIRNDGSSNLITIARGTRVTANGSHGSGVFFSYGSNNRLLVDGTVQAQGDGGRALNFDFGRNLVSESQESRGSYIHTGENGQNLPLSGRSYGFPLDLDGALMRSVAISGSVSGSEAAIYMADSALVRSIGILSGASLEGDIISLWDPDSPRVQRDQANGHSLHTTLTFGAVLDDEYVPSETAGDPSFLMHYTGRISGPRSILMKVAGGTLETYGDIDVKSIDNHATLALNQVATGAGVRTEQFANRSGATLVTELMPDGSVSTINASKTASLDGTWVVRPHVQGYLKSGDSITLRSSSPLEGSASVSGSFSAYALETGSNTLKGTFDGSVATFKRESDAYSSNTTDDSRRDIAGSIDSVADHAHGGLQDLIASLDFLPESISMDTAMAALSPEVYNCSASSAIRDTSRASRTLSSLLKATELQGPITGTGSLGYSYLTAGTSDAAVSSVGRQKVFFIQPYGDMFRQYGRGTSPDLDSYSGGVIAGLSLAGDDGFTFGINGGASLRHTMTTGELHSDSVKSAGGFLGVHAFLAPPEWGGSYLTLLGKAGVYENKSKRNVSLPGVYYTSKADYSSFSYNLFAEAGHDFKWGTSSFGPMVSLEYAADRHGSFSEHGSGATDLKVGSRTSDSLMLSVGAHHLHTIASFDGVAFRGDFSLRYAHDFLDMDYSTRSSFREGDGNQFTSTTDVASRDTGIAGYELAVSSGTRTFRLSAEYELGDSLSAFSLGAYFNARF